MEEKVGIMCLCLVVAHMLLSHFPGLWDELSQCMAHVIALMTRDYFGDLCVTHDYFDDVCC